MASLCQNEILRPTTYTLYALFRNFFEACLEKQLGAFNESYHATRKEELTFLELKEQIKNYNPLAINAQIKPKKEPKPQAKIVLNLSTRSSAQIAIYGLNDQYEEILTAIIKSGINSDGNSTLMSIDGMHSYTTESFWTSSHGKLIVVKFNGPDTYTKRLYFVEDGKENNVPVYKLIVFGHYDPAIKSFRLKKHK